MATKNKKRPLRRAKRWAAEAPAIALKLIGLVVALIVLGLMFSMVQGIKNNWLRVGIVALVLGTEILFFWAEGANKGSGDAMNSRQVAKMEKEGKAIEAREDAACYHPLKALCGALMLFALPLVLAAVVAVCAKEYTYILQDLPTWMSSNYAAREDVLAPLAAYTQISDATLVEWLRVISRLFMLPFVSLFSDPQRMTFLIDRISPLCILVYPLAYTLGYLCGPREMEKLNKQNKRAKKVAVRKQQKSNLVNELLGETNVPHYGHKAGADKPKKKELI